MSFLLRVSEILRKKMKREKPTKVLLLCLVLAACSACAGKTAFRRAETAFSRNEPDLAVQYYMRAVGHDPENVRYRFGLNRALIVASNGHLKRGDDYVASGEWKLALLEYQKALDFNPESSETRKKKIGMMKRIEEESKREKEKSEIEQLKERAEESVLPKTDLLLSDSTPFNIKLGDVEMKTLFRFLQRQSGVKFLFDESFQSKRITVDMENVRFKEAVEKILLQTKCFYKIIDEKTVIIVPNTPAKRREYDEQVMRTFFLSNADAEAVQKNITAITGVKTVSINSARNSLTLRDTKERVDLAGKLLQSLDKPRAEVLVDVEITEVNRSRLKKYGIELSQYEVQETFAPGVTPKSGESVLVRGNRFRSINSSDFLFSVPSLAYKLLQEDGTSKIKAKPQLRIMDQEKAKISLGDKVPIPTTTFVPNYGQSTSTSLNQNPITSYQLQEVGISIEISPRIHHDGWITLQLDFQFTFITDPGSATVPPSLGNRSVSTLIRLRDNETGLLAGLLRDQERNTMRGFPGLSQLPILKHLFSSNEEDVDQTDIILTLTPRIIRFPEIDESDLATYWVGTEENLGLKEGPPASPFQEKNQEKKEETTGQEKSLKGFPVAVDGTGKVSGGAEPPSQAAEKASLTPKSASQQETIGGSEPSLQEKAEAPQPAVQAKRSGGQEREEKGREESFDGIVQIKTARAALLKDETVEFRVFAASKTDIRALELELNFDPTVLQVRDITEGRTKEDLQGKGQFFKAFDNQKGKIQLSTTSLIPGAGEEQEVAVLRLRTVKPGAGALSCGKIKMLDSRMHEVKASFIAPPVNVTGS